MIKILGILTLLWSFSIFAQCCDLTLDMTDEIGDGWDGSYIEVMIDNVSQGFFFPTGKQSSATMPVCDGQMVEVKYVDGTVYDNEVAYKVYNSAGLIEEVVAPKKDSVSRYVGNFCNKDTLPPYPKFCNEAQPICASGLSFRATIDKNGQSVMVTDPGNDYDCWIDVSADSKGPSWYYMKIKDPGDLHLQIEAEKADVDYICWGPYPDIATALGNCNNYTDVIDCSYSTAWVENFSILNAQAGDVYVVLLRNYGNIHNNITLEQVGGTGSTDCSIVNECGSVITGVTSSCNPFNNYYDISGEVFLQSTPSLGSFMLYDGQGQDTVTFDAPFNDSYAFTLDSLNSDGTVNYVVAQFKDSLGCRDTLYFNAPIDCQCAPADIGNSGVGSAVTLCRNNMNFDLFNYLDGSQIYTGIWFDSTYQALTGSTYNPRVNGAGSFYYITGANGCEDTAVVQISLSGPTIAPISDEMICINDTVVKNLTIFNNFGAYTCYFSNGVSGVNNFEFFPVDSTSYSVYVVDATGCESDSVFFTINVYDSLRLNLSYSNDWVCKDSMLFLQANVTGGYTGANNLSNYSFNWGDDNGQVTGNTFKNIGVALAANNKVWVTVNEANVCNSPAVSDTVFLNVYPKATISLDQNPYLACAYDNVVFNATVTPVSEQGNLDWDFGNGNLYSGTNLTVSSTYNANGVYNVSVQNVSPNNCPTDTVFTGLVEVYAPIIAANEYHKLCIDDQLIINTSATEGYGNLTQTWNQGLTGNGPHTIAPNQPTNYEVYITDDLGCQSQTQLIEVDYYDPLQILDLKLSDSVVCLDFPFAAQISVTGGYTGEEGGAYTINWYSNGVLVGSGYSFNTTISQLTSFTVEVDELNQCNSPMVSDAFKVDIFDNPTLNVTLSTDTLCEGEEVELMLVVDPISAQGNVTWTLNGFEKLYGDVVTYTLPYAGVVDVAVENVLPSGCFYDTILPAFITVNPKPNADFVHDPYQTTILDPTFELINRSSGDVNNIWYINTLTGGIVTATEEDYTYTFNSEEGGLYPVTLWVENEFYCTDTVTKLLTVKDSYFVYVPSGFSPNGDGLNDEFTVKVLNVEVEGYSLSIFDRWGRVVFQSTDLNASWDGTFKGENLSNDVYYFHLNFMENRFGKLIEHEERGHFNIVR